jgi:hypothetical protein
MVVEMSFKSARHRSTAVAADCPVLLRAVLEKGDDLCKEKGVIGPRRYPGEEPRRLGTASLKMTLVMP